MPSVNSTMLRQSSQTVSVVLIVALLWKFSCDTNIRTVHAFNAPLPLYRGRESATLAALSRRQRASAPLSPLQPIHLRGRQCRWNLMTCSSETTDDDKNAETSKEKKTPSQQNHPSHESSSSIPRDETPPTVLSRHRPLFKMTRPSSIPGVVLFHMIGIYLALEKTGQTSQYWNVLLQQPTMWLTLASLVLVSSTSMVINDYYDAKLGRDIYKKTHKVLLSGTVPLWLAKRYVTYLYSCALVCVCFLPGAPARLAVTVGLMLTYLYTKHLKPLLLVKNVVCASLVALTPWTSGAAASYLTQGSTNIFAVPALWRLFASLFFGVLGREIMLDCNDVIADQEAGVKTLPLVYGRGFASGIALGTTVIMSAIVLSQPILELKRACQSSATCTVWNVLKSSPAITRRFGFALTASLILLRRSWQVYRTRGKDSKVNSTAVDESLITVVFLLASFV